MGNSILVVSPRLQARIAGLLYLIIILAASFAEFFVRGRLVQIGAPSTTAANLLAHEPLYRLGGAAVLVNLPCDVAVALLFYEIFIPVSRGLSLLAAFFRLTMVAILGLNLLYHFAPLIFLEDADTLAALTEVQLQALGLASLKLYSQGFFIGMIFFGFHCLIIGYLLIRSTFLPRILGVLMVIAGLSYLIHSYARFLAPELAIKLFPYLVVFSGLPELALALWLLIFGVNDGRWREQAATAGTSFSG